MTAKRESQLACVLRHLDMAKGNLPAIAEGSGVPYQTITKIAGRFVADPRSSTVQMLHDYFESRVEQLSAAVSE